MANPVTPPVSPLALLQNEFCLIKLSGQIFVIERSALRTMLGGGNVGELSFYKRPDGDLLMRRYLEAQPTPSDAKKVISSFWVDPSTHVYDQIAFRPGPTPITTLNYWTGPTVPPQAGNWSSLSGFLRSVICDNDSQTFDYLIQYLAHMLQKPEEKPGIIIVMLAEQGAGKGSFFRLLSKIWSHTTLQVLDVEQVVGHFNAALERHYVICMDEAIFKGDNKNLERLKSLITEPRCRIEQKYQPSRTIESYHRFFAASNSEHFAHISRDDRRFLFLRVSSKEIGNSTYFEGLYQEIESSAAVGAMVHDLLQLNLKGFNVRQRPKTKEHLSQKLKSLTGFDRFWHELLLTGEFIGEFRYRYLDPSAASWDKRRFISTARLTECYKTYDKNADRYGTFQPQRISDALKTLCPSAKSSRTKVGDTQSRGYDLPSLDTARREFELAMGSPVDWLGEGANAVSADRPVFQDWQLEGMRETYDLDDGTAGPEDDVQPEKPALAGGSGARGSSNGADLQAVASVASTF